MRLVRFTLTAAFVAALVATSVARTRANAADKDVVTGNYGDLMLGYDATSKVVTGYFQSGTGDDGHGHPQFSCIFFLRGMLDGGHASVETFFPATPKERISGTLTIAEDVKIGLKEEHGGCANVEHFADAEPASFALDHARAWTRVGVVKSAKANFYTAPDAATAERTYVVKGDGVGLRESRDGFVHADYLGTNGKTTSGWLRADDLYPTSP